VLTDAERNANWRRDFTDVGWAVKRSRPSLVFDPPMNTHMVSTGRPKNEVPRLAAQPTSAKPFKPCRYSTLISAMIMQDMTSVVSAIASS